MRPQLSANRFGSGPRPAARAVRRCGGQGVQGAGCAWIRRRARLRARPRCEHRAAWLRAGREGLKVPADKRDQSARRDRATIVGTRSTPCRPAGSSVISRMASPESETIHRVSANPPIKPTLIEPDKWPAAYRSGDRVSIVTAPRHASCARRCAGDDSRTGGSASKTDRGAQALVLMLGVEMPVAIGTPLVIVAANSTAGFLSHLHHVQIPWGIAAPWVGTSATRYLSMEVALASRIRQHHRCARASS